MSSKLCVAQLHARPPAVSVPPPATSATIASSTERRRSPLPPGIEVNVMDQFCMTSDRMFSAEGCIGIRSSSGVLPTRDMTVTTQDDRNSNGKDTFFSDWPELVGFDDLEACLRNSDPTFEIGINNYFKDILWSSNCSPQAQPVPSSFFDDIDFSIDRNDSSTLKVNTTETKQQSRRRGAGSSGTPLDYGARGFEGLEAILCSSPEVRLPAASSTICTDGSSTCSGPDIVSAHVPRSATKTKAPFNGAPDMILEDMAENPLEMYFPPLPACGQKPETLMSDTTSSAAPKHRFPVEFAGSCALSCAELQFCSEGVTSSSELQAQDASAKVVDAAPVKHLGFQKLQDGMHQVDLATRGRIRDSLYRLANNLEQRHCVASASGGLGAPGSKRFKSGGWAETQTNPMDRSVAQLLLHKPSYRKTTVSPHRAA